MFMTDDGDRVFVDARTGEPFTDQSGARPLCSPGLAHVGDHVARHRRLAAWEVDLAYRLGLLNRLLDACDDADRAAGHRPALPAARHGEILNAVPLYLDVGSRLFEALR